ncbi:MAG: STAS domain-containing protein [Candidatus Zixiibacteriota bacterium]
MKIEEKTQDGVHIFSIKGKIMGGEPSTLLRGKITETLESGMKDIILDLSGVDWMNSIGLGLLVSILNSVKGAGGRLRLANIDKILKILTITKLVTIFEVSDTTEEALAALK